MLKEDVPAPYENNNKVLITNDYGNLDYSFLEEYTTDTATNSSGDLIVTDTSGKLNNSFLYSTNSKKANSVVITDASGLINYNLLKASTTPTASYIPIASNTGKLDTDWLITVASSTGASDKDKLVLTGSNGKINNNLLNASTSPTANTIPLSDSNGKINDAWLTTTVTSTPNTIVKLDSTGKLDSSLIKTGLFIPMTGGEPSGNIIIQGSGSTSGRTLADLKTKYPNFYGFGSNSYSDGFLIGMNGTSNSDNYLVIATLDDGNEPIYVRQYAGSQGYLNMPNNKVNEITLMDKDGYTTLLQLTSNGNITSTNGGLSVKNNITTSNGNLSVKGTSTLTGNTSIGGTLGVSGDTSLSNNLSVTGTTAMTGNLSVTGTSTLTGKVTAQGGIDVTGGNITLTANSTATSGIVNYVTGTMASNDHWRIAGGATATDSGFLEIATDNNGSEPIYVRQYTGGGFSSKTRELILLDASGNTTIPGNLTTTNGTITAKLGIFTSTADVRGSSYASPAVTIGPSTGVHLELDQNEIQGKASATTVGDISLNSDGGNVYIADNVGASSGSLYVPNGNISTGGTLTALRANFTSDKDANGWSFNNPALTIGPEAGVHLEIDQNEIQGKSSKTTIGDISLNSDGGNVYIADNVGASSGSLYVPNGNISTGGSLTADGNTTLKGTLVVTGTITAPNYNGKWAGYTQDIGTKPSVTGDTWILLNNNAKIQHTTISDIISLAKDAASRTTNGYTKLPSGIIIQWGKTRIRNDTTVTINFNQPYFSTVYTVIANMQRESGTGAGGSYTRHSLNTITNTTFSVTANIESGGSNIYIHWIAVGV